MKKKLTSRTVKPLTPEDKPYEVVDTDIKGFLLRVQPSGAKTYSLSYRNSDGMRQRYKIGDAGSLTPQQARDIAEKEAARVASGIDIQAERKKYRASAEDRNFQTLRGFIEHKYEPWVLEHRKSGKETVKRIERNFGVFYNKPLMDINAWVIEKWQSERLKAGIGKVTVHRDVSALKAALSKAAEWELIPSHPLAKVKPLKLNRTGKVRYLSGSEEKQLRKTLQARDIKIKSERDSANKWRDVRGYELLPDLLNCHYADHHTPIVLLAINTGLRRGELFDLKWEDINFRTKILTVEGETAKSGDTRHIPLNPEALGILKKWKVQNKKQARVFYGKKGTRLDNIKTAWRGMISDAKIKNFRFHDLRHTFASKLVMKGVPLNTVRELLGHSDLKTTLRYAHLAPDHKADAVLLLNS